MNKILALFTATTFWFTIANGQKQKTTYIGYNARIVYADTVSLLTPIKRFDTVDAFFLIGVANQSTRTVSGYIVREKKRNNNDVMPVSWIEDGVMKSNYDRVWVDILYLGGDKKPFPKDVIIWNAQRKDTPNPLR